MKTLPLCLPLLFKLGLSLSLLALQGCASVYKPQNKKITAIENGGGYRLMHSRGGNYGDHFIFLAFSGGGTRAAALSYGVLKELRDTEIESQHKRMRLLDEVDSISSVSGGSFTAAYYGLFGDRLFEDYEKVFLRQSIQSTLIRKLFDPGYWWRSLTSGLDRTELAIDYYDSHIFEHKTFSDIRLKDGPFIEINATDLGAGSRFAFSQAYFDIMCSDLGSLPVARAVTASSAVPVAFPTVVLKNYAGSCDLSHSKLVSYLNSRSDGDERIKELRERLHTYTDPQANPYVHLVDGGITDNLGLRAVIERIETINSGLLIPEHVKPPKTVLVILVNAAVDPERNINQTASKPSVVDTIDAFSDVQMSLYSNETKLLLASKLQNLEKIMKKRGHEVRFYTAEVSFESLKQKDLKSYFNSLPTSLELSDSEIDMLIGAGRNLLRTAPGFREFLLANHGQRVPARARADSLGPGKQSE